MLVSNSPFVPPRHRKIVYALGKLVLPISGWLIETSTDTSCLLPRRMHYVRELLVVDSWCETRDLSARVTRGIFLRRVIEIWTIPTPSVRREDKLFLWWEKNWKEKDRISKYFRMASRVEFEYGRQLSQLFQQIWSLIERNDEIYSLSNLEKKEMFDLNRCLKFYDIRRSDLLIRGEDLKLNRHAFKRSIFPITKPS